MSFHVKDGWYFTRHPDGSVTVDKLDALGERQVILAMDPNAWASVVSSVSAGGEEDGRYYQARAFHMSEPIGCSCELVTMHDRKCLLGIKA